MHDKKEVFEAAQRLILEQQTTIVEQNKLIESLRKDLELERVTIKDNHDDLRRLVNSRKDISSFIITKERKSISLIREFLDIQEERIIKRDERAEGLKKYQFDRKSVAYLSFFINIYLCLHLAFKRDEDWFGLLVFVLICLFYYYNYGKMLYADFSKEVDNKIKKSKGLL